MVLLNISEGCLRVFHAIATPTLLTIIAKAKCRYKITHFDTIPFLLLCSQCLTLSPNITPLLTSAPLPWIWSHPFSPEKAPWPVKTTSPLCQSAVCPRPAQVWVLLSNPFSTTWDSLHFAVNLFPGGLSPPYSPAAVIGQQHFALLSHKWVRTTHRPGSVRALSSEGICSLWTPGPEAQGRSICSRSSPKLSLWILWPAPGGQAIHVN